MNYTCGLNNTGSSPIEVIGSVLRLAEMGWRLFPVESKGKRPCITDWPTQASTDPAQIRVWCRRWSMCNWGAVTGSSSGFFVLDVDGEQGVLGVQELNMRHGENWTKTLSVETGRGIHLYFLWPEGSLTIRNSAGRLAPGLDIRGAGGYVLVPPSVHANGQAYHWSGNGEHTPIASAPDWLLEAISEQPGIAPAPQAPAAAGIPAGRRNQTLLSLAGTMRKRGMTQQSITAALKAENQTRCEPPLKESEVEAIARSVGRYTPAGAPPSSIDQEWPEPQQLEAELLPVAPFSLDFLPTSFRPLVEDVSERMQTPPDFAAAAAVVALAGCVNRRAAIKPKRHDDWTVVGNLWGAVVGKPGYMKSPVLRAIVRPLLNLEQLWQVEHKAKLAEFEKEREETELCRDAWRQDFKQAVKKGGTRPIAPDDSLTPPPEKRLLLTDCTYEKLHEILVDNPAGILIVRDELAGWLSQLDKPGRESERQFYLQGWNGDGHFNIDRIGRGTLHVPAVCVSLFGNIQPGRLRTYLQDSLAGGPSDDGLIQRFQMLVWPDPDPEWELVDRKPNRNALAMAESVFSKLVEIPVEDPLRLSFDFAAQELFFVWWHELEAKVRGEHGLHPALVAHLSKYRGLFPTLAALFEVADRVASSEIGGEILITLDHAQQAAGLVHVFGVARQTNVRMRCLAGDGSGSRTGAPSRSRRPERNLHDPGCLPTGVEWIDSSRPRSECPRVAL